MFFIIVITVTVIIIIIIVTIILHAECMHGFLRSRMYLTQISETNKEVYTCRYAALLQRFRLCPH